MLSKDNVYKNKDGEPTPMEILALQTYLSGIVEQVIKNDSREYIGHIPRCDPKLSALSDG